MKKPFLLILFYVFFSTLTFSQQETIAVDIDTLSKFDVFNKKAEHLFKVMPVPLYSYSTEAGHIFGVAKFNLIKLSKYDTISQPSKISEVFTISTEGRINVSVSTDFVWGSNKYMFLGYINYKKQPEYILGIGNDVSIDDIEQISFTRFKFVNHGLIRIIENLYIGIGLDIADYISIEYDSTSFLIRDDVTGKEPNTNFGVGLSAIWDSRDNRYNAYKGSYLRISSMFYPSFLNNPYLYSRYLVDARKYYNPWYKHVIALQATTSYCTGDVPFYDLALLGGEDKMRGYYLGALRDKVLFDTQIEYRMPVWKILGVVSWIGTGRVAESYNDLSLDGFWLSYGFGLRIKVDSENNTNLRLDWGFGRGGIKGFYINFAEAF